jgi:uncharacterized beta-barrel protein YwiB (DUF1934 family)
MKDKNVIISIKGTQRHEQGFFDEIDVFTTGKLKKRGEDGYEISYLESDDDHPGGIKTTLHIEPQSVTIEREPFPTSRMTVQDGQRHLCHYDTGFGHLMIGVFGEKIISSIRDDGGELSMKYTIDINSSLASRNELHITVKEA